MSQAREAWTGTVRHRLYQPQQCKQVTPQCENSQTNFSQPRGSSLQLCLFIEKPSKPARAPGLHRPHSSDTLQGRYILPLKHFFKLYYGTMWL